MPHVFISYSKKNQDYARRLASYLTDNGFDIWIDDRIDYGENWLQVMMNAVYDCAAFIVIMTHESKASKWVQREVAWAESRDKRMFPILLSGENWPEAFILTQYADCRDGSLPNSRFILELSNYAPSRQVKGRDVTPERPMEVLGEEGAPAQKSPSFDCYTAITDFLKLREEQRWLEARVVLVRIEASGDAPTWFDVAYYSQSVEVAIERERAERQRQQEAAEEERRQQEWLAAAEREYAMLRLLARHEEPERVQAALQVFWQSYEGYDPDGLAEKVRPAPPNSPEAHQLLDVMLDSQRPPVEREEAGQKIAEIGDPRPGVGLRSDGVPDIDWVEVPAGKFIYQDGDKLSLPTLYIGRYPITFAQFEAFLDAPDGFGQDEWWQGLTPEYQKQDMGEQYFKYANHPRETVSWYQAVAFCRWLSARLGYEVRLPTEQEWEKAARGTDGRAFPYEGQFDATKGNTEETGLGQTSAVGIFPDGASPFGVLDMSGNVGNWCLNEYHNPENTGLGGDVWRVLRGGSWLFNEHSARCADRYGNNPDLRYSLIGFRVCASSGP